MILFLPLPHNDVSNKRGVIGGEGRGEGVISREPLTDSQASSQSLGKLPQGSIQPLLCIDISCLHDLQEDGFELILYSIVGNSNHLPPMRSDELFATFVVLAAVRVAMAIDFNDEAFLRAREVDRVRLN